MVSMADAPTDRRLKNTESPDGSAKPSAPNNGRGSTMRFLTACVAVAAFLLPTRVSAARIVSFDNCLPGTTQQSSTHLQFHPLVVGAELTATPDHTLTITIWGNVTGESTLEPGKRENKRRSEGFGAGLFEGSKPEHLQYRSERIDETLYEKWDQSVVGGYQQDPNIPYSTTGEIVDTESKWRTNKATTLITEIKVLSYTPSLNRSRFRDSAVGIGGQGMPMKSVIFREGDEMPLSQFPKFSISQPLNASYAFSSLSTMLKIISGDPQETQIGCIQVEVTPSLGKPVSNVLRYVPLGILALVGVGTVLAAIFNPWNGTTDIFRWSSNYGMDQDMLRLVTPGFGDCLQYLQFIVLAGTLSLNYPGFFQPVVTKLSWSVLVFNESFVTKNSHSRLIDGIYAPNGTFGMENLGQYVGLGGVEDLWVITMIVFAAILGGVCVLILIAFWLRWLKMKISDQQEEDLRSKKWPFVGGMVVRLVYNYCLNPVVAFSAFQLVIASRSPTAAPIVAGLALGAIVIGAALCLWKIRSTKPRHALFDQLEVLLLVGPLYNTYTEKSAMYCFIQIIVNVVRALAFGAGQQSGIAQLVLLALCEGILILTLVASRPFSSRTSMNLYYTFFSSVRLLTVLFSVAFVPSMAVDDATKGWIGYVILLLHGMVLIFGFFLNAVQTIVEVFLRMAGVGDDGGGAATRGALVFGMRQLSRRTDRGEPHPYTDSPPVLETHERKLSALTGSEHLTSSGYLDVHSRLGRGHGRSASGSTALTPTSPLTAPHMAFTGSHAGGISAVNDAGPYYRAPRAKNPPPMLYTADPYSPGARSRGSWSSSGDWATPRVDGFGNPGPPRRASYGVGTGGAPSSRGGYDDGLLPYSDEWDAPTAINTNQHSGTGTPPASSLHIGPASDSPRNPPRIDYAVRESDFYYGVRGPALSNQHTGRHLRTGPADPTGPVAMAKGWFKRAFKRTSEGKPKGFEVVRSSRRPDMRMQELQAAAAAGARSRHPEGTSLTAHQDEDSDVEDYRQNRAHHSVDSHQGEMDSDIDDGEGYIARSSHVPSDYEDEIGDIPSLKNAGSRSDAECMAPSIPRKSSKRKSQQPPISIESSLAQEGYVSSPEHERTSRLPFSNQLPDPSSSTPLMHSRTNSNASSHLSTASLDQNESTATIRPPSVGNVQRHRMHESLRIPPAHIASGSSAELVQGSCSEKSDIHSADGQQGLQ